MEQWKFPDPPNVAVFLDRGIVTRGDWIAYVSHDDDDGSWQFHNSETGPVDEDDIVIVSLQNVVQRDESILALADLPEGWHAWRASKSSLWQRAKSRPVPSAYSNETGRRFRELTGRFFQRYTGRGSEAKPDGLERP